MSRLSVLSTKIWSADCSNWK